MTPIKRPLAAAGELRRRGPSSRDRRRFQRRDRGEGHLRRPPVVGARLALVVAEGAGLHLPEQGVQAAIRHAPRRTRGDAGQAERGLFHQVGVERGGGDDQLEDVPDLDDPPLPQLVRHGRRAGEEPDRTMARNHHVKPTAPLDETNRSLLQAKFDLGGGSARAVAADPFCPVSEQTLCRALAGQALRAGQRMALVAWLDGRLAAPPPASTTPTAAADERAA